MVVIFLLVLPHFAVLRHLQLFFCKLWRNQVFQRAYYATLVVVMIITVFSFQRYQSVSTKYKTEKQAGTLEGEQTHPLKLYKLAQN